MYSECQLLIENVFCNILYILQELLGRVELVVNRRGELEVELSLTQQRLINEREHSQDLAAAMAQSAVELLAIILDRCCLRSYSTALLQSTLEYDVEYDRNQQLSSMIAGSLSCSLPCT